MASPVAIRCAHARRGGASARARPRRSNRRRPAGPSELGDVAEPVGNARHAHARTVRARRRSRSSRATRTASRFATWRCAPTSWSTTSSPISGRCRSRISRPAATAARSRSIAAPRKVDSVDRRHPRHDRGDAGQRRRPRRPRAPGRTSVWCHRACVGGGLTDVPDFAISPETPKQLETVTVRRVRPVTGREA